MPCYYPIQGYISECPETGARKLVPLKFEVKSAEVEEVLRDTLREYVQVPCGRCIGCRLEHSRQWAIRIMHETMMHVDNCFLTLTYDDDHLPGDGSLKKKHFQDFMKRLRKHLGFKVRYYHCGEYGEQNGRPHYHAVLFGFDVPDGTGRDIDESMRSQGLYKIKVRDGEFPLFECPFLTRVWGHGMVTMGSVTFESAAYVARYVTKKVTGVAAEEHYRRVDAWGNEYFLQAEYATMSRKPGIGAGWFERFGEEVYPCDEVIARGRACKPPRYYDKLLDQKDPSAYEGMKEARRVAGADKPADGPARRRVKEVCSRARLQKYGRTL